MSLAVKFNDVEITQYITVLDGYTSHVGADWKPTSNEMSGKNGDEFVSTRYGLKSIPMPFEIKDNINDNYDKLSKALKVSEPKELILGNMPDRVFYAIPKGNFDFSDLNKTSGVGTIVWVIPDGLAHATTEKTFTAAQNASDITEVTVVNSGTESVPVSYDITHNHENGFVGIVSEYGVLQYGSISEEDGEVREKSQVLVKYTDCDGFAAMTEGKGILASNDNFPMDGKFIGYDSGWLKVQSSGSGSSWHGAARQLTIPADSSGVSGSVNFKAQTRIQFISDNASQDGLLEFVVGDADGNHLASIHIVKGSSGANAYAIFQVQAIEKNRVSYEPNASSVTKDGQIAIQKQGEQFDFVFGGKTYSYRVPEAADKKAMTITIFAGQYGTRANPVEMGFRELSFTKNNVQYTVDIPNRYADGDVIMIDGETTKMYVNGTPALGDEVKGSVHFHVPPGETKIQFYFSDFCSPLPDVRVRIREAYL